MSKKSKGGDEDMYKKLDKGVAEVVAVFEYIQWMLEPSEWSALRAAGSRSPSGPVQIQGLRFVQKDAEEEGTGFAVALTYVDDNWQRVTLNTCMCEWKPAMGDWGARKWATMFFLLIDKIAYPGEVIVAPQYKLQNCPTSGFDKEIGAAFKEQFPHLPTPVFMKAPFEEQNDVAMIFDLFSDQLFTRSPLFHGIVLADRSKAPAMTYHCGDKTGVIYLENGKQTWFKSQRAYIRHRIKTATRPPPAKDIDSVVAGIYDLLKANKVKAVDNIWEVYGAYKEAEAKKPRRMEAALTKMAGCVVCGIKTGGEKKVKLLKCSRCKVVYYCGADHQRADWKNHKKTCVPATS